MANEQQSDLLKKGVDVWNQWRMENLDLHPDLSEIELQQEDLGGINLMGANLCSCNLRGANLMGANLAGCDLRGANLSEAYLSNANFFEANLCEANLREAYLFEANLTRVNLNGADLQWVYLGQADLSGTYAMEANLSEADLRGAYLIGTNLSDANLQGANLSGADLQAADLRRANLEGANLIGARLLRTNFEDANLAGCSIYGISCWELNLLGANQSNLAIAHPSEPIYGTASGTSAITADNLEVAQFIYLLLNHKKTRQLVNRSSEVVMVLGNFKSTERKDILDTIKHQLHLHSYLSVVFDLDQASEPNLIDTIFCLAQMAQFLIVDLTEGNHIEEELKYLISQLKNVPVQPLQQKNAKEFANLQGGLEYPWVWKTYEYHNCEDLTAHFSEKVIAVAQANAKQLLS